MTYTDTNKGDTSKGSKKRGSLYFGIGISLMVISFIVYLVYPLILLLSYSIKFKVVAFFVVSGIAWTIFSVGLAISGREGYRWLKDFMKRFWKEK